MSLGARLNQRARILHNLELASALHCIPFDLHESQARPVRLSQRVPFGCRCALVLQMNEVEMARNQNRKQPTKLNSPVEEETTSVRPTLRGMGANSAAPFRPPAPNQGQTRLGPEQEASLAFHTDRPLGDAGAEFAEDLGRDFLMAATTGEDIGEIQSVSSPDASGLGEPFLHVTDELEDLTAYAEPVDDDDPPPPR